MWGLRKPEDPQTFFLDFLPEEWRLIRRDGRAAFPQQCLYFFPESQGQESLHPIFRSACRYALASAAILGRCGAK
jgi:hypothetical protein